MDHEEIYTNTSTNQWPPRQFTIIKIKKQGVRKGGKNLYSIESEIDFFDIYKDVQPLIRDKTPYSYQGNTFIVVCGEVPVISPPLYEDLHPMHICLLFLASIQQYYISIFNCRSTSKSNVTVALRASHKLTTSPSKSPHNE